MKNNIDIKSLVIGFLSAGLLTSVIGFKNNSSETEGKFQTVIGEKGVVILDTHTGAYILAPYIRDAGKMEWIKGEFYNTHKVSKDNKKVNIP